MGSDRRLAWLLGVDIATAAVGVAVLLASHFFIVASGYFLLLAAMVAGAGLVMASAYRPLRVGRADRAVAAVAAANYLIALGATAIAPFAMPILLLATLFPAILAVPYVSRRQLHGFLRASFITALGVAALGSLQDVTGFRDVLPGWLESGVVILFIPFMTTMVSIIALTNATVVDDALQAALHTNDELVAAKARLADNVMALRASRARVVAAAERERRRIERDLHDGAQQALVTAKVQLAGLRQEATRVDATLGARFDDLRDQLHRASIELRDLARGIHPTALTEGGGGLASALRQAVAAFPGDATVDIRTVLRFDPEVERAVYFCLMEALQNAFKHGGDGIHVRLVIDGDESEVRFAVSDDGPGFDPSATSVGTGLDNMAERLGALGGELSVSASIGGGTRICGALPTSPVLPVCHAPDLRLPLPRDTRWPSGTSPSARAVWTSALM
jgi:signal transduction histidine kinase